MAVIKREISDYLDNEYKGYAMYVIESRALPSVVDGLKSVQKKIIKVSKDIWKNGGDNEKEMKVFQLTGKIANECLEYNTKIHLANGKTILLGDWAEKYPNVKLDVLCVDENLELTKSLGHSPRCTKEVDEIYEIELVDGFNFKATGNHLVMLIDGNYKRIDELTELDEIKSILR